jgi:hypothetical protein
MNGEQREEPEHEGERYLHLLGLGHLADIEITAGSRTLPARDFLEICGKHARPMLIGFEAMDSNDPRYDAMRNVLRGLIGQYVEGRQD